MDKIWISVDEKMPKEGETVLVYDGYDYFTAWWWKDEGWYSCDEEFNEDLAPIVKWMNIPKI